MSAIVDRALRSAVTVLPPRWRTDRRSALVGLTAVRPHLGVAGLGVAAVLRLAGLRRASAVAGLAGAAAAAPALRRVLPRPSRPLPDGPELTVLVANVLLGRADTGALAATVARERPDVVVLPEAGSGYLDRLRPLLDGAGYRGWSSVPPGVPDQRGTVVLVAMRAGAVEVRPGPGMRLPHLEVSGGLLGARTLYAVHTSAPTNPRWTELWAGELALVAGWTRGRPAPVVAGDLNAVVDHRRLRAALGGCVDATDGTGRGLVATFPSSLPRWAGIRIDHVLVPRGSVTRRHVVLETPGSDHRAVLVTVRLPGTQESVR
ncbi:endonuclease/exonuclease/phosphatase family protein [Pseudonocardia sp. ICBG1293]|uniref:endonuclease/exonuclease/phosphatase family protein n=1 Tax=Pseudonocardia sp. ICBG1293 TaxID=2844382 RepID=UPI001CCDC4E5|nr:endonuclease/exonuclease/phosphatase family protein [Pseudonocardia sp. ICBG1293]